MNTHNPLECADLTITDDVQSLAIKEKMMARLKWNALLSSVSDSAKFIAGPLFAIGASALILNTAAAGIGIWLLASAAVVLFAGVASGFAANRIWQEHSINTAEMNAQSTARSLVHELQANNLCFSQEKPECHEEHHHHRADGKTWQQFTAERDAATQQVARTA